MDRYLQLMCAECGQPFTGDRLKKRRCCSDECDLEYALKRDVPAQPSSKGMLLAQRWEEHNADPANKFYQIRIRWAERLDGVFNVYVIGGVDDNIQVVVESINSRQEVGRRSIPEPDNYNNRHEIEDLYRRTAEQLVSDYLRWTDIPTSK